MNKCSACEMFVEYFYFKCSAPGCSKLICSYCQTENVGVPDKRIFQYNLRTYCNTHFMKAKFPKSC